MRFRVAADDFLRFCAAERQLSELTIQAYTADLADFRRWFPNSAEIDVISEVTLKDYLANMITVRNLSPATVRRRFACLRAFFRRLSDQQQMPNPFTKWYPKLVRRKRLPRSLSRTEASSLLLSLNHREHSVEIGAGGWLPTAVRLMVGTGIRVGELCKLRVDDVSPDGSALRIHGKGSRDRVAYVIDPSLRLELSSLVGRRRGTRSSHGALLINRHGGWMRPQSIRSKLRRYAKEVGLARRITPHMLRHTASDTAYRGGR